MNYDHFKTAFMEKLPEYLPAEYQNWEVCCREIIKVNGAYDAIHVMPPDGHGGSPTLYVNEIYSYYEACGDLGKACQKAAAIFVIGMDYLSQVGIQSVEALPKDRIVFVLIPQNGNERLLSGVPHRLTLDLAVIYRIVLETEPEGVNSAIVNNEMAAEMKLTEEELYELALENTPEILPVDLRTSEGGIYILTNQLCIAGASVILYPGVLSALAEDVQNDLFILPASLNEVFVVPDTGQDVRDMNTMVQNANETVLHNTDVLADHVYYYHRETNQVCIPKWE